MVNFEISFSYLFFVYPRHQNAQIVVTEQAGMPPVVFNGSPQVLDPLISESVGKGKISQS